MRGRLAFVALGGVDATVTFVAALALLTTLLSVVCFAEDAPVSADLADVDFFTAHAAALFARAMPEAKIEIKGPLALSIGMPGRGPTSASLDNVYSFCLRRPEACEESLVRHVVSMAASFEAPAAVERSQLRAIVRQAALVELADKSYARRGGATVSEKLIGDLWVMCAQDLPGAVGVLNANDLAKLKLSREEALTACKENVAASLPPLKPFKRDYPSPGVNLLTGDPYEASLLIFPERWTEIAESLDGDLLVAAPANNALIYASGRDKDAVATLAKAAEFVAERAQKPLSTAVFRWTPTGWEEAGP
ncbi:MAG TPA: hypothetical protein VKS78_20705 [Roseiarcus sp.]|nr:hypothetical protein [Roseiarcus sp.]